MKRWLAAVAILVLASPLQATGVLVGYWNFDEGFGDVASDSSGEAYHGTVDGATWILGGYGPHALRFDGGDGVDMGNRALLEPATMTVAACLRTSSLQGTHTYIVSEGLNGCSCSSYAVYGWAGNLYFYTCTGSVASLSAPILSADVWDGSWHRIVGTYDGVSVRIYLDGVVVGDPVTAVAPNYSMSSHSDFSVGRLGGGCSAVSGFVGDVDEVMVWDGVLSDVEIQDMGDCGHIMSDDFEGGNTASWALTIP